MKKNVQEANDAHFLGIFCLVLSHENKFPNLLLLRLFAIFISLEFGAAVKHRFVHIAGLESTLQSFAVLCR
jgi:hypothetical protein